MAENKTPEELIEEKLIEQKKKERQAELEKIKKINIEDPQFYPLKNILRDRAVASQNEFVEQGKKTTGLSVGYIAKDKARGINNTKNIDNTKNIFILKHFYKTQDACLAEKLTDEERKEAKKLRFNDEGINFVEKLRKEMLTTREIQELTLEEQYVLINKKNKLVKTEEMEYKN